MDRFTREGTLHLARIMGLGHTAYAIYLDQRAVERLIRDHTGAAPATDIPLGRVRITIDWLDERLPAVPVGDADVPVVGRDHRQLAGLAHAVERLAQRRAAGRCAGKKLNP